MKRKIKYGLIIIAALAGVALVFYIIKKPKQTVIKNIPADVTYCFTVNKRLLFKESDFLEDIYKDSFIKKLKAQIPSKAFEIYNTVGLSSFGDIALFGEKNSDMNLAWIGNNEKNLEAIIRKYRWTVTPRTDFSEIKISDNLYLCYKWPLLVLSSNINSGNADFFNPTIKKLTDKDLRNAKTDGCLIYGFFIPDRNFILSYSFIPLYGRAFVGLKKNDKNLEVFFVQRRVKLTGKLGTPSKLPLSYALLSWPIDSQPVSDIKHIPDTVHKNIDRLITKPVTHLYAEALDTMSTYQEIVRYNLDAEFKLTQKIINSYKTHPGLRLEFIKKTPDSANVSKPTTLGLDIFKLQFAENGRSYIIASEDNLQRASQQNMPDYYLYANLEQLKTDPFWEPFIKTSFKKLQLHAEPFGKGSVFILTLSKG